LGFIFLWAVFFILNTRSGPSRRLEHQIYPFIHWCGDKYEHTGGRKGSHAEGIIALAIVIPDMEALSLLNVASNSFYAGGTKLPAEALKGNQIMTDSGAQHFQQPHDI
jgi:hypothetical protein